MISRLKALIKRIRLYIQITEMGPIARRYFVKNGFDGSMTMLGIIVGASVVNVTQPEIVVTAGLGACLAMGISGLFGAYMTEKAERKRDVKNLENAMMTKLDDSVITDASSFVSFYAAIVDGGSPILTALISLSPFILALYGLIVVESAYLISLIVTLVTLFTLGMYLGKIAKENALLYGIQTLVAGVITIVIALLLGAI
ncbi:MAG: VIT1/CCC1 transporter family protein [Candidatus Bathyarchaeota archaeon]|nr:VIT1/CCC1 transporter family protein [Candidatus Bathyarchaeota archaeon]